MICGIVIVVAMAFLVGVLVGAESASKHSANPAEPVNRARGSSPEEDNAWGPEGEMG